MSLAGQGLGHLCLSPCATGACLLQFYGYLSQQQNMMQDYVRTGTYQRAILQNHTDFKDKVSGSAGAAPRPPRLRPPRPPRCQLSPGFFCSLTLFLLFLDYKSKIFVSGPRVSNTAMEGLSFPSRMTAGSSEGRFQVSPHCMQSRIA